MKKRRLVLEVEIDNQTEAKWLWEAHGQNKAANGIKILSLRDGTVEDIEDDLAGYKDEDIRGDYFMAEDGEDYKDAIGAHVNGGFYSLEVAKQRARSEFSSGTKYNIIDKKGKVMFSGVAE